MVLKKYSGLCRTRMGVHARCVHYPETEVSASVMTNEESLSYRAFSAMVDNVEALSLVRECRGLEERYGSDFTSQILNAIDFSSSSCAIKAAEDNIVNKRCSFTTTEDLEVLSSHCYC